MRGGSWNNNYRNARVANRNNNNPNNRNNNNGFRLAVFALHNLALVNNVPAVWLMKDQHRGKNGWPCARLGCSQPTK